jgi:hypothetical protein
MGKALANDSDSLSTINGNMMDLLIDQEREWLMAREKVIALQSRMLFWYGDNSNILWVLSQLISYAIGTMLLMFLSRLFDWDLTLWHYVAVFIIQTAAFVIAYTSRGRLAQRLERRIAQSDQRREQSLDRLYTLATDSILRDIHAHTPLTLLDIESRYQYRLQLASLQLILQKEVEQGRLLLNHQDFTVHLPPEFAEYELHQYAGQMIYKSML